MKTLRWFLSCCAAAVILSGFACAADFTDVAEDAWYADAVTFVCENNLMTGTSEDTFSPEYGLTRVELAAIMYRMKGSPAVAEGEKRYSDVPDDAWFRDAVTWAGNNELVLDYPDGTFRPDLRASRAALYAALYRLDRFDPNNSYETIALSEEGTSEPFLDEFQVSSDTFKPPIVWARRAGFAVNDNGRHIKPYDAATRAYAAAVLQSFLTTYPIQMAGGLANPPAESSYNAVTISSIGVDRTKGINVQAAVRCPKNLVLSH